jgi:hypothetical protein
MRRNPVTFCDDNIARDEAYFGAAMGSTSVQA